MTVEWACARRSNLALPRPPRTPPTHIYWGGIRRVALTLGFSRRASVHHEKIMHQRSIRFTYSMSITVPSITVY